MLWTQVLRQAVHQGQVLALQDGFGPLSYRALASRVQALANTLPTRAARGTLAPGQRIALLCTPGRDWTTAFLAVLARGHVAVPLALVHPPAEWRYVLEDAGCSRILASGGQALQDAVNRHPANPQAGQPDLAARIRPLADALGLPLDVLPTAPAETHVSATAVSEDVASDTPAFLIYTSGSTGKPKGVLHTQGSLAAQVQSLGQAWSWKAEDAILNVLPLHHIHGMVNVYASALWHGAAIRELHGFEAGRVWTAFGEALAQGHRGGHRAQESGAEQPRRPSLFMAVPTVYQKLLQHALGVSPEAQKELGARCRGLRLMVSGSAALPVPLLQAWEELTGQRLLERYGMSEIGMGLSQALEGPRHPGTVGMPLPGVECRILPQQQGDGYALPSGDPSAEAAPETGELLVRGPGLFVRYWERPQATKDAFLDTWFRTGDVVARYAEGSLAGHCRILGRQSVDILKSGGYKISALEIEAALLAHPAIREAAVVGLDDPEWGQRIAAALVLNMEVLDEEMLDREAPDGKAHEGAARTDNALAEAWHAFLAERLAPYKIPRTWRYMDALPRNALGKVVKPDLLADWPTA